MHDTSGESPRKLIKQATCRFYKLDVRKSAILRELESLICLDASMYYCQKNTWLLKAHLLKAVKCLHMIMVP